MDRNILISVIVPVYNVKDYLGKCVDSICSQSYDNLEIILVDDGSTDGCAVLCDEYALRDERIKVIHKPNGGLVSARKAGLLVAKGGYISNIDGDDYIEPDMYEKMIMSAQQYDADMIQCGLICEDVKGDMVSDWGEFPVFYTDYMEHQEEKIYHLTNWLLDREGQGDYKDRGYVGSQMFTKICRNQLAKEYLQVPDDMSFGEDFVGHLCMLKKVKSVVSLKERFYHYVHRTGSITQQSDQVKKIYNESRFVYKAYPLLEELFPEMPKETLREWLIFRQKIIYDMSKIAYEVPENPKTHFVRIRNFDNPAKLFNKKIVVYGAGLVGRDYINQLSEYEQIHIVAWVDKNPDKYAYPFRTVVSRECLQVVDFDIVIAAVAKAAMAESIRHELEDLGIDRNKVIWHEPVRR